MHDDGARLVGLEGALVPLIVVNRVNGGAWRMSGFRRIGPSLTRSECFVCFLLKVQNGFGG